MRFYYPTIAEAEADGWQRTSDGIEGGTTIQTLFFREEKNEMGWRGLYLTMIRRQDDAQQ